MYLIFDTETTGLPKNWRAPISDTENWPRCVQLAWQVHDEIGNLIESKSYIIKPDNFDIPYESEKIHGISTLLAEAEGIELDSVLNEFNNSISKSKFIIGHNVNFDLNVIGCEFYRRNIISNIESTDVLDTCTELTADLCKLPGGRGGKFKLPTLTELHQFLFESSFEEAHNASADVEATARCFLELIRIKNFKKEQLQSTDDYFKKFAENNPRIIEKAGVKHQNLKKKSEDLKIKLQQNENESVDQEITDSANINIDDIDFKGEKNVLVIDCTGKHNSLNLLNPYINKYAKYILVSAPIESKSVQNIVYGVNHNDVDTKNFQIFTSASCTTNCLAPIVKVLEEKIGIEHGSITTIHNITNSQNLVDSPKANLRRSRSGINSLIPTTTGSAKAISLIYPELKGRLNGHAVRVPLLNASLTDCVFEMKKPVSVEEINKLFIEASASYLKNILSFEERPLVSSDYVNNSHSAIIDGLSTMVVNRTQLKVYAWYDSEWGYACRMVDLISHIMNK